MVTFEEIKSKLPLSSAESLTPCVEWVHYPKKNPYFVPPSFMEESSSGPDSPILLISAPGAVGKTTVADAIAYDRHAPVIDLSKRRVGTDAFIGLIGNAFGYEHVSSLYERLKDGKFLLVIDALDETRIGSGQSNFEGFLEDIGRHFKRHQSAPSIILLARVDTADLIELALKLHEVPFQRLTISLFDETAAAEFIDRYLDAKYDEDKKGKTHRVNRGPFEEVRNKLFNMIKTSTPDGMAKELIGYAPVLIAIAARLYKEENYHALSTSFDKIGSRQGWDLLAALAKQLLEREQRDKFLKELPSELVTRVPNALSSDEQCYWLLLDFCEMQTKLSTPTNVPSDILSLYECAVESQMTEHPFRSYKDGFQHLVFREYVLAWYLAVLPEDKTKQDIRKILTAKNNLLPTPLLARFALEMSPRQEPETLPIVAAEDIGFLYESFAARADKEQRAWITVDSILNRSNMYGSIGIGDVDISRFLIADSENGLFFWRKIANAQISVRGRVQLGTIGSEFVLGPDVEIECGEFLCPVRQLFVYASESDKSVTIYANASIEPSQPTLTTYGNFFHVNWPRLSYPWVRHQLTKPAHEEQTVILMEAYTHLARILKRLRSRGYGSLARHRDIIENIATGGTSKGRAILKYCIDKGIVLPQGNLFVLDDIRAGRYGINWPDLRLLRLNDNVKSFLSEFIQEGTFD